MNYFDELNYFLQCFENLQLPSSLFFDTFDTVETSCSEQSTNAKNCAKLSI